MAERPQGIYARQVFLGDTLDAEHVQADCQLGMLSLTIPVAETAKPRQVPVSGGQDAQTIAPRAAGGAQAAPTRLTRAAEDLSCAQRAGWGERRSLRRWSLRAS